jgi:autotransporter-associated beta strand protein
MNSLSSRRSGLLAAALSLPLVASTQALDLYWNPAIPDGIWDENLTPNWGESAVAPANQIWFASDTAFFHQDATYTVTLAGAQTASAVNVQAGSVTLAGVVDVDTLSTGSLSIAEGASFTGLADVFLGVGTTALEVNGALIQTGGPAGTTRRVTVTGGSTGSIDITGNLRTGGAFTFAGNLTGSGGILTDAAGTFTLGGTNTYLGNTLFRHGNTIRLNSASALSPDTLLRFGAGTNIIELAAADFSRTVGGAAGNIRFHGAADGTGSSGFAAVGADRSVTLGGTFLWGDANFRPSALFLGNANSTHKVTLLSGLDLNGGNRTISSTDGSAEIEGEITGTISGGAGSILTKTGSGRILLSVANSHAGGTSISGLQNVVAPLRISHAEALGTGTVTVGSGGNSDASCLELTGGIAVTNTVNLNASRNTPAGFTYAAPHLVNVSGDNSISSNLGSGGGGGQVTVRSDAGKLTLSGNIGTRQLNLTGDGNGETTGNIPLQGTFGLVKDGAGIWTLSGAGSYVGTTSVVGGTLALGNLNAVAGSARVEVAGTGVLDTSALTGWTTGASQTLAGTSTITGSATVAGTLAPGTVAAPVGTLTLSGDLTLDAASSYAVDIDPAGTPDKIVVGGALAAGGTIVVSFTGEAPFVPVEGSEFDVADAASITGTPTVTGALPAGLAWDASDFADTGKITVVAGTPFQLWAAAAGLSGNDALPEADPDSDGLENAIEYVIGGNPDAASRAGAPEGEVVGNDLVFTFSRVDSSETADLTLTVEAGTTLGSWPEVFIIGADNASSSAGVNIEENGADPDTITVTIPKAGELKKFARLKAVITP